MPKKEHELHTKQDQAVVVGTKKRINSRITLK
jgi:hypothetical protein